MSLDCYRKPGSTMTLMGRSQKNYRVVVNNANSVKKKAFNLFVNLSIYTFTGELTTLFWKKQHLTTFVLNQLLLILLIPFFFFFNFRILIAFRNDSLFSTHSVCYASMLLSAMQAEMFSAHWRSIHILLSNETSLWFHSVFHGRISVDYTYKYFCEAKSNLIVNVSIQAHVVLETNVRVTQLKWMHASRTSTHSWPEGNTTGEF